MDKIFIIGTLIVSISALALPAHACDMHFGGGFDFRNPNANWQSYHPPTPTPTPTPPPSTPPASTQALALGNENTDQASLVSPVPAEKARPSFSNAANRAAVLAKTRLAQKTKDQDDKMSKEAIIQKTPL